MINLESLLVHALSRKFVFLYVCQDGADQRMESSSCKQSLHTFSPSANDFTFLTISHLMLKLMLMFSCLFFIFQTLLLSVVEVLFCSNLKDDLCKLNLVLNSFSVRPIDVFWLFEVVCYYCFICKRIY